MEFESRICTTKEQSKKLLSLGLKKETADMVHAAFGEGGYKITPYVWLSISEIDMENFIPAWSLHRLLLMLSEYIDELEAELSVNQSSCGYTNDDKWVYFTEESDNIYDNIITCIGWLIKKDYFNKEYLEEVVI